VDDDTEAPLGETRLDPAGNLEHRDADLGEPELVLLDEIERQHVGARRHRRSQLQRHLCPLAGRDGPRQRCAQAVPDDGVAELVQPVRGDLHAGLAA
jgi:hypothetical protein